MKVTGVMCEVCERFSPTEEPPSDWFVVVRGGEATDVCSPVCLCKVGKQMQQLEAQAADGKAVCSECGKPFKNKQGLGLHMTRAHKPKETT